MKKFVLIALALLSVSAMARTSEEVISEIEAREVVSCVQTDESSFKLCLGMPAELAVCRWSETYECSGDSNFSVKLKMKSAYSNSRGARETNVSKVIYLK